MVFEVSPCNGSKVTYQTVNSLFKLKILALSFMKQHAEFPRIHFGSTSFYFVCKRSPKTLNKLLRICLQMINTSIYIYYLVYYSHSDIKQLVVTLNSELQNLDIWMKSNKLSVNQIIYNNFSS